LVDVALALNFSSQANFTDADQIGRNAPSEPVHSLRGFSQGSIIRNPICGHLCVPPGVAEGLALSLQFEFAGVFGASGGEGVIPDQRPRKLLNHRRTRHSQKDRRRLVTTAVYHLFGVAGCVSRPISRRLGAAVTRDSGLKNVRSRRGDRRFDPAGHRINPSTGCARSSRTSDRYRERR
jgi:hypothetical protein